MTQAPSTQPASNPEKEYNNKNRLISGEYQMKSYKYTELGAALENFISKKCFQTVFFVSAML
jgi:hypothetical protein